MTAERKPGCREGCQRTHGQDGRESIVACLNCHAADVAQINEQAGEIERLKCEIITEQEGNVLHGEQIAAARKLADAVEAHKAIPTFYESQPTGEAVRGYKGENVQPSIRVTQLLWEALSEFRKIDGGE